MADRSSDAASRTGAEGAVHHDVSSSNPPASPSNVNNSEAGGPSVCRWQTNELHGQECSRYFDCPSHTVERQVSNDEERDHHDDSRNETTSNYVEDESQHPAPRSEPESLQRGPPADPARDSLVSGNIANQPSLISQAASQTGPPSGGAADPAMSNLQEQLRRMRVTEFDGESESLETPASLGSGSPTSTRDTRRRSSYGFGDASAQRSLPRPPVARRDDDRQAEADFMVPRWQPDAEVTLCPICHTQFSIFVRKHHCRKCGRVVCNSCSPHRIIIPHQYIVRPPGSEIPMPQSLLMDSLGVGFIDVNGISGGERVRLCNPCVPDPNIAPPQSPRSSATGSTRSAHHRSRSSLGNPYGPPMPSNRQGAVFASSQIHDPFRPFGHRTRSIAVNPTIHGGASSSSSGRYRSSTASQHPSMSRSGPSRPHVYPDRYSSLGATASSSRQRRLPPTPQIAEEDECPVCHRELPSKELPNWESLRETHITSCIQNHSTYGTPRNSTPGADEASITPRRTGMYTYPATEKDCIDDAECTICLEEFTVGVPMARLECLCRFHRSCIAAWFVNHPGRCPVHQHDGFGY